jgi:hypothetical protein
MSKEGDTVVPGLFFDPCNNYLICSDFSAGQVLFDQRFLPLNRSCRADSSLNNSWSRDVLKYAFNMNPIIHIKKLLKKLH